MVTLAGKTQKKNGLLGRPLFLIVLGLLFCLTVVPAGAFHFSDHHSLNFDAHTKKMVGEEVFKEINRFFHDGEMSMETKNMNALLDLYSDNYVNGPHKKESVKKIWEVLFSKFDDLSTMHNMRFITTSPESNVMIIRCSGLLMGVPKGEKELIAIDNWVNTDHVLAKENGKWRLIGSSGKEKKRFWFDKPLHPLF